MVCVPLGTREKLNLAISSLPLSNQVNSSHKELPIRLGVLL